MLIHEVRDKVEHLLLPFGQCHEVSSLLHCGRIKGEKQGGNWGGKEQRSIGAKESRMQAGDGRLPGSLLVWIGENRVACFCEESGRRRSADHRRTRGPR